MAGEGGERLLAGEGGERPLAGGASCPSISGAQTVRIWSSLVKLTNLS